MLFFALIQWNLTASRGPTFLRQKENQRIICPLIYLCTRHQHPKEIGAAQITAQFFNVFMFADFNIRVPTLVSLFVVLPFDRACNYPQNTTNYREKQIKRARTFLWIGIILLALLIFTVH